MTSSPFSATRHRSRLIRRLRNLRNIEWFNVPFLIVVLASLWSDRVLGALWQRLGAYVPAAGLLVVGGWYWHRKMLQIRDGRPIAGNLALFDRVDRLGPVVLGILSAALIGS